MNNPFMGQGITLDDKPSDNVEFIIDGFLAKGAITTYYAPPKHGKSVVAQALAKYICNTTNMRVQYFDFDNGLVALVERGWFEVVDELSGNLDYINKDKAMIEGTEAIQKLLDFTQSGKKGLLDKSVLIFDSATNFVSLNNDDSAKKLMKALMWFRANGATVLLLHHMNKSGRGYEGSQVFVTASDNVYEHTKVEENEQRGIFTHKRRDTRFSDMRDIAFEVEKKTFNLKILDFKEAIIPPSEQAFINETTKIIKKNPGIKQGELLKKIGKDSGNKNAKILLNQYKGRCWITEKGSQNSILYYLP